MPVLDRSELEASPLADLHALANELGVDGFRLLRREQLIDAILGDASGVSARDLRSIGSEAEREREREGTSASGRRGSLERRSGERRAGERTGARPSRTRERGGARNVEGPVEVQPNGSALLRVRPPGSSNEDVYVSAAQVKRCELASGDVVSGPVREPRRSERHRSLSRIETINGEPADTSVGAVPGGGRGGRGARSRQPVPSFPTERLTFGSDDATLQAVERLAPLGYGSRASIVGPSRAGKTELLRRMLHALAGRSELELALVLVGVRPEEIPEWQAGPVKPSAALSFAASPDAQGQAVEEALHSATGQAGAGKHAVVLIDTLDGLHPHTARRALASAHNLSAASRRSPAGSLTVIGTGARPYGGETTVIALDVALASSGRFPALDVMASGTLRPELLVGEDGARTIMRAHAEYAAPARGWRRLWRR
jgi:transcription termination factor Rho